MMDENKSLRHLSVDELRAREAADDKASAEYAQVAMPVIAIMADPCKAGVAVVLQSDALAALAAKDADLAAVKTLIEAAQNEAALERKAARGLAGELAAQGAEIDNLKLQLSGAKDLVVVWKGRAEEFMAEGNNRAAEIAKLKTRLEIDSAHDWDGIACRDQAIKGLAKLVDSLNAQVAASEAVPIFANVAAGKLAELQRKEFKINGYSFEKLGECGHTTRGFITHVGLVGWWQP